MKLLTAFEDMGATPVVTSSSEPGRLARLTYSFKVIGALSRNKRFYQAHEVRREVERLGREAREGKLWGNVEHPRALEDLPVLDMNVAASKYENVSIEGDTVTVVQDILDNPHGQQLHSIIKAGGKPGLSQRGAVEKWRPATASERAEFGVAKGEPLVAGVGLRLFTFDNVTRAGMPEADFAKALEALEGNDTMDKDTLKSQHPALYAAVLADGAASVDVAKIKTDAVEAAKPTIVAEAVKPGNERIAVLTEQLAGYTAAVEDLSKVLIAKKLIVGTLADVDASKRITAAEGQIADLNAKVAAAVAAKAAVEGQLAAEKAKTIKGDIVAAVEAKFKGDPDLAIIVAATEGATTIDDALKAAESTAKTTKAVRAAAIAQPKPNNANPNGNTPAPRAGALSAAAVEDILSVAGMPAN